MFDFVKSEPKSRHVGCQNQIKKDSKSRLANGIDFPTIPDFCRYL